MAKAKKPAKKPKPAAKPAGKSGKSAKPGKVVAKPAPKPTAPKPAAKPQPKPAPKPAGPAVSAPAPGKDAGKGRKGITIVTPKPMKRPKPKGPVMADVAKLAGQLLKPGGPIRKPLIPSGPKAAKIVPLGSHSDLGVEEPTVRPALKTPFNAEELERFRQILLRKRSELAAEIGNMERQALQGEGSGGLSHVPQHMAEHGSEAYDQSLALDLAAAERKLIREIDEALKRIEAGTYGLCERTHKPIPVKRLEELPWARYSIEAAREFERRSMRS